MTCGDCAKRTESGRPGHEIMWWGSGEQWVAGCSCGWMSGIVADRRTARQAAKSHYEWR